MSVENTFNYNRTDGSFNINRKYIVLDLVWGFYE
jgi:hypothetical protein